MAKKSAAKTLHLFRTIQALLLDLQPTTVKVGYHSNPKNQRTFSYDIGDGFHVSYENEDYFVLINYTKDMKTFEVLLGHTRNRKHSGNNADISFTQSNFDPHFLLVVAPSLKRCKGRLASDPARIGDFPARVVGTENRFLIGFPDSSLFPRLFHLCLAKRISIESFSKKSPKTSCRTVSK